MKKMIIVLFKLSRYLDRHALRLSHLSHFNHLAVLPILNKLIHTEFDLSFLILLGTEFIFAEAPFEGGEWNDLRVIWHGGSRRLEFYL